MLGGGVGSRSIVNAAEAETAAQVAAAEAKIAVKSFERRKPARRPLPEHLPRERIVYPSCVACQLPGYSAEIGIGELGYLGDGGIAEARIGPRGTRIGHRKWRACRQEDQRLRPLLQVGMISRIFYPAFVQATLSMIHD